MSNDSGRTDVSFVCSLPSPGLTARRAEIQGFIEQATSVVSRPDGVMFAFANTVKTAHALVDFILFEQQCCSSITYELRSEPRHSHFTLRLRAPADQVGELQKIYTSEDKPERRLGSSTAEHRIVGTSRGLNMLCNMAGPVGAVICAVVCLGIPIVSASLGVVGMNILRQDGLSMGHGARTQDASQVFSSMACASSSRNFRGVYVCSKSIARSMCSRRLCCSGSVDRIEQNVAQALFLRLNDAHTKS
jgi:hypothetical protein